MRRRQDSSLVEVGDDVRHPAWLREVAGTRGIEGG